MRGKEGGKGRGGSTLIEWSKSLSCLGGAEIGLYVNLNLLRGRRKHTGREKNLEGRQRCVRSLSSASSFILSL